MLWHEIILRFENVLHLNYFFVIPFTYCLLSTCVNSSLNLWKPYIPIYYTQSHGHYVILFSWIFELKFFNLELLHIRNHLFASTVFEFCYELLHNHWFIASCLFKTNFIWLTRYLTPDLPNACHLFCLNSLVTLSICLSLLNRIFTAEV